MPTIKVDAHELSKVKVEFISLVHRPANRLPIRIMKGDTAVLDLDSFNRKTDAARVVKADKVSKAAKAISDATLLLVQAGYKVIAAAGQEDERADDGDAIDADPVTADDGSNPAAGTTGTDRLDDGSPNSFSGDTPSLNIAVTGNIKNATIGDGATPGDALCEDIPYSTQGSPVAKADKGKKMKQPPAKVGGALIDAAHEVVGDMDPTVTEDPANPNPTTGGKKKVMAVAKAAKPDPVATGDEEPGNTDDAEDPENPVTADDDEETGGDGGGGENDAAVTKPSVVKSKTKKAETDQLSAILAGLTALSETVAGVSTAVQKTDARLGALDASVNAINARVQKTDKALSALVPGQAPGDHEVRVVKDDTTTYPLIDTAFKHRL